MPSGTAPPPPSAAATLQRQQLGVWQIVGINATAATPFTVVSGVAVTAIAVTGQTGLSGALAVVPIVLALLCVGLARMAPHVTGASLLYTYVTAGLGRSAGVAAGGLSQLAYHVLQYGLYGLIGFAAQPLWTAYTGWTPPWWFTALLTIAVVGVLGPRKLTFVVRVVQWLLLGEVSLLAVYGAANLLNPAGPLPWQSLNVLTVTPPMLVMAVLGFETAASYTAAARNGYKTVTWAMIITLAGLTALYVLSVFGLIAAVGADAVVDQARAHEDLLFLLAQNNLGDFWVKLGQALFFTSVLGGALSTHVTCSSHTYSLAAEGAWLRVLGTMDPRTGTPLRASRAQSGLGVLVVLLVVGLDGDPLLDLFYLGGTAGALALLALVAVSIVVFTVKHRAKRPLRSSFAASVAAAVLLVVTLGFALAQFATLLGPSASPIRVWGVPLAFAAVFVAALGRGLYLRRYREKDFLRLGTGPSATGSTQA